MLGTEQAIDLHLLIIYLLEQRVLKKSIWKIWMQTEVDHIKIIYTSLFFTPYFFHIPFFF